MRLYHGSHMSIEHPDVSFSRNDVDFGKGFYTTAIRDQAERWCDRFKRSGHTAVVSVYELDKNSLRETKPSDVLPNTGSDRCMPTLRRK